MHTITNKPQFKHDCNECHFLGCDSTGIYDLYYHDAKQGAVYETIIARFSNDGKDYKSGLCFAGKIPELTEAYEKAKSLNLIS